MTTIAWSQNCCDAADIAIDNCQGIGCYIPQCTENCEWEPMQCWGSTGYCWCVDPNGVEIEGTSMPSWQGLPDCEESSFQIGDECITSAGETGFYDCEMCCWPSNLNWLGDGWCDYLGGCGFEGSIYNCPELGYDCGDCNDDWDGSDPFGLCSDSFSILGDLNNDEIVNVLDVVILVNHILSPAAVELDGADINIDGNVNILDIVQLVNIILINITIEQIQEGSGYSYQCYPNNSEQLPVILYNHGGLGQSVGGDLYNTCRSLAEHGYLARAEKRGETITLEGHLEEIQVALNELKNHEYADSNKVGIVGFSRGGLLSLQISILDDNIDALVLLAPATGNGLLYDLFDDFDSINSFVLIQVSENDNSTEDLVNVSYDIYDTLLQNNVNVEIIEYPPYDSNFNGIIDEEDDGHQLFFIVQEPYWSDLINFLNETLN